MTKLPFRWVPASRMWHRGYPIDEIAAIYDVPAATLARRIKLLQTVYKDAFPERRGRIALIQLGAATVKAKPRERRQGKLPKSRRRAAKARLTRRAAKR